MGFDVGAFIANLFLSYFSQNGHKNGPDYAEWVLEQIQTFWNTFETVFCQLWNDEAEHTGMAFGRAVLGEVDGIAVAQKDFMAQILADTLGFAGMKMLRRIVGIAHVEDLESIEDANVRAQCERCALETAKAFIKGAAALDGIDAAIAVAKANNKM